MLAPHRSVLGILLVLVVTGCGSSPTPSPRPTAIASASATTPPSTVPSAASTPSASPVPSPSPATVATPVPGKPAVAWTSITWRRLATDDPLTQFRSVTRWRGGYIARGNPRPIEGGQPGALHTQMWSSSDGRSWTALDAAALGGSTIVVGMAATPDGLVALTFASGQVPAGQDAGEMLKVAAPLRSWSSPDGVTWTDHPGPDVALPAEGYLNPDDIEWLQASTAPRLIVAAGSRPPFSSTDGVTWTRATTSGPPSGFSPSSIKAVGSGFVAVADNAIASSPDGGTWTKHALPTGCSANEGLVIGRAGSIATGLTEGNASGVQPWVWCRSFDIPGVAQAPEPDAARPDVRCGGAGM